MPAVTRRIVTLQSFTQAPKPSRGTRYLALLLQMASFARQRRHPGELPDHLLKDIGIAPDEARREARRKAWDIPTHWWH